MMNKNMSKYKPDWLEAKQRMTDWWSGKKVDRVVASVKAPKPVENIPPYIDKTPDKYTDPDTVFHNLDRALNSTLYYAEAFPFHFVYFGPMFTVTHFGAEPTFTDRTTWYKPNFQTLDEIIAYKPDFSNNKWWNLSVDMHKKSAERADGSYLVTGIGFSSYIDILDALLGTEKLLCAMAQEPEKVIAARDNLIKHTKLEQDGSDGSICWLGIWTPGKVTCNQCDLCVMISPEMFDRFVFDDLKSTYDQLDRGMYHLDGEEEIRHLDSLFRLDKLQMIQWVPNRNHDPLNWIDLFKRIQNAGRSVLISTPYTRVRELLNKLDRDLVYLDVWCPNEQEAAQVMRELERK